MNELFDICVDILEWIASVTGTTYKQANIWIFVIIHPLLTLIFMLLYFYEKGKNAGIKRALKKGVGKKDEKNPTDYGNP